jgi:hypothetical protein
VRHQKRQECGLQIGDTPLRTCHFRARFRGHLDVVGIDEFARLRQLILQASQPGRYRNDGCQAVMFFAECRDLLRVARGTRIG